jgi:3-methyladenine DNA glycosylase AlkC
MSTLLKDLYSTEFYNNFSELAEEIIPAFDKKKFIQLIFDETWQNKELKERMKHTSMALHQFLPKDFEKATGLIEQVISKLRQQKITEGSLEFMFFPQYIETYGIDHFEASVKSIEFVTQFTSCEFAVRPFIIKYEGRMVKQMHQWSLHESHHVRRLASEGIRPRLPWAMALPALKKDPSAIMPILDNLKRDPSEYVRRSVANNLNDIAKDNPKTVITIAKKWKGISKETDAIIKHGCRTLLKQGNIEILKYYGFDNNSEIEIANFKIMTPIVKIGSDLLFSFTLHNKAITATTIRLEYAIHYLRQNGRHAKKVFKISERQYQAQEKITITRKQSFREITTRNFYAGQQGLSLIVNGKEYDRHYFDLTK